MFHMRKLLFGELILILLIGIVMCFFLETNNPFSLALTMLIFTFAAIEGLRIKISRYSFLTRAMVILYALPFVHCLEYIVNPDIVSDSVIWGIVANPYNANFEIVTRMAMIGCIGMLGLTGGYLVFIMVHRTRSDNRGISQEYRSIGVAGFSILALISVGLAWLNAPADNIFIVAYTKSHSIIDSANIEFSSAGLLSKCFAAILFIDAFNEHMPKTRRLKMFVLWIVLFLIVIWFGILVGSRRSTGLILALVALFLVDFKGYFFSRSKPKAYIYRFLKVRRQTLVKIAVILMFVFVTFQIIGAIRSSPESNHLNLEYIKSMSYLSGTWSAVLLTPLSVTGDIYFGLMEPKWGKTYRDYLLSLPPGSIAQLFGYERPISKTRGPAWDMRYGLGGTHVMVVPYMNFKSFGVFFILLIYGIFIGYVESKVTSRKIENRLFYACVFISAPFWFWYTDMDMIRSLMAFCVVLFTYRLFPKRIVIPHHGEDKISEVPGFG